MTPADRKYTNSHEWVKIDGTTAIVGITDHAQDALGDITFIELPKIGKKLGQGDECAVIESVKAASDIYAPLSGEVTAVNSGLETEPEKINASPYEDGWIIKLSGFSTAELGSLMDAAAYDAMVEKNA